MQTPTGYFLILYGKLLFWLADGLAIMVNNVVAFQYDPESAPVNSFFHGHPRVILAYLKYQWSLGDDLKRRDAFSRLQVCGSSCA